MPANSERSDSPLDRFVPVFDVREHHETRIAAPVAATWDAVRTMDLRSSSMVRGIFRAREWLMGSRAAAAPSSHLFLDEMRDLGWHALMETPGRALVMGAVTQPWEADVTFRGMPAGEFTAFEQPGYAKIAWTLEAYPDGPSRSRLVTETRVRTTDPESTRRFRRYWWLVAPGIRIIRRRALALVKAAAEASVGSRAE